MENHRRGLHRNSRLHPRSRIVSRIRSLRRSNSGETFRPRSLPPNGEVQGVRGNEVTFAVVYGDASAYHVGRFEEMDSIRSERRHSFANSLSTLDSTWSHEQNQTENHSQAPLSLLSLPDNATVSGQSSHHHFTRNGTTSEERLTVFPQLYSSSYSTNRAATSDTTLVRQSNDTWCICIGKDENQDLHSIDLEAQAKVLDEHTSGSPGGSPGLPPFPPGFLDELKVTFSGPEDRLNPQNWPAKQKWAATACIAAFTFLSPLASSMIAPALAAIEKDFGITNAVEGQITLSIFVLAFALGPMILAPLSELYGRVIVSQSANVFFLIFNLLCGFAQSKQQFMAFRFLSGFGGSAPMALGGGVLGDIFKPEERGRAMGLYAMGPLLGPAIGPLVGGFVAQYSTWRWMFWATSIVNVIILVCSFIWFKETYGPYLLHEKAKKLRQETGNQDLRAPGEEDLYVPVHRKVAKTMARAFGMLFTQPIVQVMSLYMGFSYGIMYLMLSTYPVLWRQQYGQSTGISGLNYISLALGFFLGAPLCGSSSDTVYGRLKTKADAAASDRGQSPSPGKPEYRLPVAIVLSFFVPVGLLTYGWSAQTHTFWLVPNIGAFIFGMGTIAAFQCVTTYLVDVFARYAASAVAAVTLLRSLMGFAFPLFAPAMYDALEYGWGNTVLAIAAVIIGIPTPILLWFYGENLRNRSSLAQQAKKVSSGALDEKGAGDKFGQGSEK